MANQLRTSLKVALIALRPPVYSSAQNTTVAPQPNSRPLPASRLPLPATGKGSILGIVADSLRGSDLAGADIVVEAATAGGSSSSISSTDSLGKFEVDSLAPGTYRVVVFHARLDTLGVVLVTQPFRVGADSTSLVRLAVPSALTLIRRSCGNRAGPYGESAVTGHVADPETLQPIPRA